MTWRLSAFGDEIGPDLDRQLDALASEGIGALDLRAAWGTPVLALDDAALRQLRATLDARGMRLAAVASPIGKIGIGDDFAPHWRDFQRALAVADALDTPVIRIFSFYLPLGDDPARHRDAVLERLNALVTEAARAGVTLLHENERGIYGDTPARCHDLLTTIDSPVLRVVWDPGNFVLCGVRPYHDSYTLLRPYIASIHVKDGVVATGAIVPAGQGDGEWRESLAALRESDFAGYCAIEPHLPATGPYAGFSGAERFRIAARAFTALLREAGIAWE